MASRLAFLLGMIVSAVACAAKPPQSAVLDRQWVAVGAKGKLEYKTTPRGDRILDYSYAGYLGGGVALPMVPVKRELAPSGGDDTAAIQAALAEVAAIAPDHGLRGAVLLKPGVFRCTSAVKIEASGVVLRGSGSGAHGTTLQMEGSPHVGVVLGSERVRSLQADRHAKPSRVVVPYVPSGRDWLTVESAAGFAVGESVLVRRPVTAQWIAFLGMDKLVRNGKRQEWMKEGNFIDAERKIQSIRGDHLLFDAPLSDALDAAYCGDAGAVVVKASPAARITQSGLEALRITSSPPVGDLSVAHFDGVTVHGCQDCWVRDVATHDTVTCVAVIASSQITVERVATEHTRPLEKGAGYPADFLVRSPHVLIHRCSCQGDGSFYYGSLGPGDTSAVVLNCEFHGAGGIQPHMHWNTGLLVDRCRLDGGRIEFVNRGTSGSGHGWAIGWAVAWNCTANRYQIQQPPGVMNWAIGCRGPLDKNCPREGIFSHDQPVEPPSLYLSQLRERLGPEAVKNIGY